MAVSSATKVGQLSLIAAASRALETEAAASDAARKWNRRAGAFCARCSTAHDVSSSDTPCIELAGIEKHACSNGVHAFSCPRNKLSRAFLCTCVLGDGGCK